MSSFSQLPDWNYAMGQAAAHLRVLDHTSKVEKGKSPTFMSPELGNLLQAYAAAADAWIKFAREVSAAQSSGRQEAL
ncbi:hypothetical protein ACIHEI_16580 [Kitasatospora sp. NPDC051984]